MTKKVDLVIARYKENLDWLKKYSDRKFNKIYVYNKGKTDVVCPLKPESGDVIYVKLPNVGRCDHTYIHHIIDKYDNLGDVTLFIKGSIICKGRTFSNREVTKFEISLKKAFETGDSAFTGKRFPPDISQTMGSFSIASHMTGC